MDLGLAGKKALVAGSTRGLGRAVAEALAAEGADVAICGRSPGPLEEVREGLARAHGVRVMAVRADLSDEADAERLVREVLARFGRVDVLVTNTGGPPAGPFESHSMEAWRAA